MKMFAFLIILWITVLSNLAGAQDHADEATKGQVQVRIFDNSSFSLEYSNFPIHVKVNKIIYVEVEATKNDRVVIPKECHVTAYKNCNHRPSLGYQIINEHCPRVRHCDYLPVNNTRVVRFKFTIGQYFGVQEQFIFLHCRFTTCRSKKVPHPTLLNCGTQGQHCVNRGESDIVTGPFIVWPEGFKREQQSQNVQTKMNSTTRSEVQVRIFRNDSFSLEHTRFPIHAEISKKLYFEVKATKNNRVVIPKECYVSANKNRTDHRPSEGYTLIQYHCPLAVDYLPTHNKAVRFKFTIRQFFGPETQILYIHCKMATCEREEAPRMTVFNCLTQGQYCPHQEVSQITMGPFVVVPVGLGRGGKSMEFKTKANNPVHGELQVGVFQNQTFNLSYDGFPIHFDMNSIVYVEVKASKVDRVVIPKECHVSAYKNCTNHHPSLGYRLISGYCPVAIESDYLPTHVSETAAVRFKFAIRQYFGISEQFLYLHCKMTTCQRKEVPYPNVFNCHTQAQYCPHQEDSDITVGPFVVWPVGFKRNRKSLGIKERKPAEPTEQVGDSEFSDTAEDTGMCLNYLQVILVSIGSSFGVIIISVVIFIKCYNDKNKPERQMEVQV